MAQQGKVTKLYQNIVVWIFIMKEQSLIQQEAVATYTVSADNNLIFWPLVLLW